MYDLPAEDPYKCSKREWQSPGIWAGNPDNDAGKELWGTKWAQQLIYEHQVQAFTSNYMVRNTGKGGGSASIC
jgi:hypothetical protein